MRGRGRKKYKNTKQKERNLISELPDELRVHILSFLPIFDATRTIIIRPFGDLWKQIDKIELSSFDCANICRDEDTVRDFISHGLKLHEATNIESFKFHVSVYSICDSELIGDCKTMVMEELHEWIQLGLDKNPKIVDLIIEDADDIPLPEFLFVDEYIVDLTLTCCHVGPVKRVCMVSLTSLCLYCVNVGGKMFGLVVDGLPLLRVLSITDCCMRGVRLRSESLEEFVVSDYRCSYVIDCPNLMKIDLSGRQACFKGVDLSSVIRASVKLQPYYDKQKYAFEISKFLDKLENAEVLVLHDVMFEGVTFPINRWKCVTLTDNYDGKSHVGCIYNLVRNSTCLEELTINSLSWLKNAVMKSKELSSPLLALQLRKVLIHSKDDHDHEANLQLVEFLLMSSVKLEELAIFSERGKQLTTREKRILHRTYSSFTKASAHAKITLQ